VPKLPPHAEFERQVERIHRFLDGRDATVTWDEKIPDPDSLSRTRQIDITIRRKQSLTIIECRLHKDPQDVTWIEELIGRRASLQADAVIAVSASGFTSTAIAKARRYGVFIRDLSALSEPEIRSWGTIRRMTVYFCEFKDVILSFLCSSTALRTPRRRSASPPSLHAAAHTTEAELGRFDLGKSELIEHRDELTVTIDLSTICMPENCIFETILFDAGRVMHMNDMQFIGMAATLSYNIPIELRYIKARPFPP
jgi:hypothetical protein